MTIQQRNQLRYRLHQSIKSELKYCPRAREIYIPLDQTKISVNVFKAAHRLAKLGYNLQTQLL